MRIPRVIDDYNHLMGGVDLFDQLRSYHEPKFRVRRTWMPIFLFTFNAAITNAYIVHKNLHETRGDEPLSHTAFVMEFASVLRTRSFGPRTRRQRQISIQPPVKRRRISTKYPSLPPSRLVNVQAHFLISPPQNVKHLRRCAYCSYLNAIAKNRGEPEPRVSRSRTICSVCQVNLCLQCFDPYHSEQ